MNDKPSKTDGSQVAVAGDGAEINGDVSITRVTGNAISTIIKDIKIHFQQEPIITSANALPFILVFLLLGLAVLFLSIPPRFVLVKSIQWILYNITFAL